jgi:hypothetical protein
MVVLYHYTDEQGAAGIYETGIIYKSGRHNRDAFLGEGVYLTRLSPQTSKQIIYQNNWDGRLPFPVIERHIREGRIDCVITVHIPDHDPQLRQATDGDRDIFIYMGDIDLRRFNHNFEKF